MRKSLIPTFAAVAALSVLPFATPSVAEGVKVGFMNGFAGGRGIFGQYQWEGFLLAIDHVAASWAAWKPKSSRKTPSTSLMWPGKS